LAKTGASTSSVGSLFARRKKRHSQFVGSPYTSVMDIEKENAMQHVTSKDGTHIAYEKLGQGPALVIVCGVLGDHHQHTGLARLLAEYFTVYNIDRRGHGESGFTEPYAAQREIEDVDALLTEAGGSAFVYGSSGTGGPARTVSRREVAYLPAMGTNA